MSKKEGAEVNANISIISCVAGSVIGWLAADKLKSKTDKEPVIKIKSANRPAEVSITIDSENKELSREAFEVVKTAISRWNRRREFGGSSRVGYSIEAVKSPRDEIKEIYSSGLGRGQYKITYGGKDK